MFSSAETKVVTASASGVARLWRIHDGALEWELYGPDDAYMLICVVLICFSKRGLE